MSARFTPNDIHPSIFDAMHELAAAQANGHSDPQSAQAFSKFSSVWFAEYWKGALAMGIGIIPVFVGVALANEHGGKPAKVLTLFVLLGIWLAIGSALYQKNKKLMTWAELSALRPGLNLNVHQSLYVECLQYVEESRVLDANQKKSWRSVLYNSLDQALNLTSLSKEMQTSSGSKNHGENMDEIKRIETLLNQSADPIAKDAYGESLRLATDRLSKWDSIAVQAERTEAHLELTKQTFLKTRDTLKGMSLQNQQAVQIDLEPLRANLSRVETEAHEIQRAIEELRQI